VATRAAVAAVAVEAAPSTKGDLEQQTKQLHSESTTCQLRGEHTGAHVGRCSCVRLAGELEGVLLSRRGRH
jgi:hypothetical protein